MVTRKTIATESGLRTVYQGLSYSISVVTRTGSYSTVVEHGVVESVELAIIHTGGELHDVIGYVRVEHVPAIVDLVCGSSGPTWKPVHDLYEEANNIAFG